MALYLLDTDAVIDYLNRFPPTLTLLRELTANAAILCTCDVVLAEVYTGLQPRHEAIASDFVPSLRFLAGSPDAAERAGRWRYAFSQQGQTLPLTDALIATTALAHNATLVTGNVRDYPMPNVSLLRLPR
jgi:hypothetical protein